MNRNISLYPYFQFFRNLLFWQAIWFLYFESVVTASEAILLAAIVSLSTVILEVPSGYFSDYVGRRPTLLIGMAASVAGCLLLFGSTSFALFALAQVLIGVGNAFVSGTDNALLYDSLNHLDRQDEVVEHEVRAWRFSYAALAISAVVGGYLSFEGFKPAYLITAIALFAGLVITFLFREPPNRRADALAAHPWHQMAVVLSRFKDNTLFWVFAFSVGAYVLGHVPYVFAQPFLKETLSKAGHASDTPIVYGIVIAVMMTASVIAGMFVLRLRKIIGTVGNLLLAMSLQIGLILALAYLVHPAAIFLLVLRMIPDALTRPLMLEIIHPRIESGYRATYLSLQNLIGQLAFSGTLLLAARVTPGSESLSEASLQTILPYYGAAGLVLLALLAVTANRCLSPGKSGRDIP